MTKLFNFRIILTSLLGIAALAFSIAYFVITDYDVLGFAVFLVISLASFFVFLTSPVFFIFGENSVTVTYFFGRYEEIPWNSVKAVEKSSKARRSGFLFSHSYYFIIKGEKQGRPSFFTNPEVPCNKGTYMLISASFSGKVDKY